MKKLLLLLLLCLSCKSFAQTLSSGTPHLFIGSSTVGTTLTVKGTGAGNVTAGVRFRAGAADVTLSLSTAGILSLSGGTGSNFGTTGTSGGASTLAIGATVSGGTPGYVLNIAGGSLGQVTTTGSGSVVFGTGASMSSLTLTGAANALGTPSSIVLTSATGLPVATGISGFGTGVAGALALGTGAPGSVLVLNGPYGTPSSLSLTNATGSPSGLTLNVGTASSPFVIGSGTGKAALSAANARLSVNGNEVPEMNQYQSTAGDLLLNYRLFTGGNGSAGIVTAYNASGTASLAMTNTGWTVNDGANAMGIGFEALTAGRGITFPDQSGTVVLGSNGNVVISGALSAGGKITGTWFATSANNYWLPVGNDVLFNNTAGGDISLLSATLTFKTGLDPALTISVAGAAQFYGDLLTTGTGNLILSGTRSTGTGAQTINKMSGSVLFPVGGSSLVVSNVLCTGSSNILITINTNDSLMKSAVAVGTAGSFTIIPNVAPAAETRVSFLLFNNN